MKKIFLALIIILSSLALVLETTIIYNHISSSATNIQQKESNAITPEFKENSEPLILPETVDLGVPFIAQAPAGDWSYPFPYTCEEAAILMAHYFFDGKETIDVAQTKIELLSLVDFQEKNYGYHEDTSAQQTANLIRDYYGHDTKVVYDVSLEDIKKELALGRPVLIPTAGRALQNPNFKFPGPIYHFILLKGYNQEGFFSHDPGTAKGANVFYSYRIIEEAIHDLTEGDIMAGRRAMIAFSD